MARDLWERDYVCCWADGIHFNLLADGRRCCLVIVGVRADGGTKELVASVTATASRPTPGRSCCAIAG